MKSTVKALADQIRLAIAEGLPGRDAHLRMIPAHRLPEFEMDTVNGRKSAALFLLYPDQGEIFLPLIQRPDYQGYHSGQMALPGGKYQDEDADLAQTALREANEECGIDPAEVTIITRMTDIFIPPSNFILTPFLAFQEHVPDLRPDPREVAEIIPVKISDIRPDNIKSKEISLFNGRNVITPYYNIAGKVVWGATAMVISEFQAIMEKIPFKSW
jgi:8-oxo-dGTP pyrophosphatase MutT (NUDIX family)